MNKFHVIEDLSLPKNKPNRKRYNVMDVTTEKIIFDRWIDDIKKLTIGEKDFYLITHFPDEKVKHKSRRLYDENFQTVIHPSYSMVDFLEIYWNFKEIETPLIVGAVADIPDVIKNLYRLNPNTGIFEQIAAGYIEYWINKDNRYPVTCVAAKQGKAGGYNILDMKTGAPINKNINPEYVKNISFDLTEKERTTGALCRINYCDRNQLMLPDGTLARRPLF